jgi:glycosyltransferase involved in cell wall biosynthesis
MLEGNRLPRYVIITPARDEAARIEETIDDVIHQTIRPALWVILDDGSTDGTSAILDRYAAQYPWMNVIHRPDRGRRDADVGAVGAFLEGYESLDEVGWDFIVNLDGDLGLEPDYFENCFDRFARDPKLGIGGGTLYAHDDAGRLVSEPSPAFHVRGATKIYRRECWDAIGGLSEVPGWDTLDEVKANMTGWRVQSFPDILALHKRPTGAAGGSWRDSVKNGRSDYFLGYHPLFMLAKCARRVFTKPYLVSGVGHWWGFLGGYLKRRPQVADQAVISYVRRQQLRRLFFLESTWK